MGDRAALDADRAYYSSRHSREIARPQALSARPLCEHCELRGDVQVATQVDHIRRPHGDHYLQRHPITFNASAPTAISANQIGNGAMMVVPYALESLLTAGPSTCDTDAVTGDGGCCKPKQTKDQHVFEGGWKNISMDHSPPAASK